jgi:hypothetical protein
MENGPPHRWLRLAPAAFILTLPAALFAADSATSTSPKAHFGASVQDLGFPSLGRVVLGFLLTVALGVGTVIVMRRFWPALLQRKSASATIRPIDRTSVSATLTIHVVEVEGIKMVVAEGRSGVGVAILPAAQQASRNTTL